MSTPGRQIHHQPDRILGIKDLNEVIGTLERSGFSEDGWNELGLKLHISQPKLNTVKANNPHDVKGRLRGCLDLWLQQSYDTYKYGLPTLELLAAAAEEMGLKAVASGINPQGSTQSQTKSPKEIQHIIEVYSPNYIKNLKGKFASFKTELLKRLSRHIKDGVIELIDIARFVGATTKVKGLATTASVDDLFDSIQDHFSYLNCEHIEIFVSDFLNDEDKDLKDKMKAYKRDLDNFEKTIKLKQLEKDLDNVRLTHSHSSCKVVIKLVGEWENETLAKLKDFLKHYFKEDSLFNLVCVTDGCLSVTFLVPLSFSQYLIDTATPQLKSMSRVGVLQLIINDVELLDGKDDINLDESLIEAVKLDKPFEVSLLLSLGADPYYEDDNGDKVLELAIQGGNEEIIELISIATDTQVMELESQKELSDEEDRKFENENENLEVEIQKLQDSNAVTTIIPLTHLPNMATARGETGVEINDHLGIEDLGEVISTLEKSEFSDHRWVELGLKLHISQKELDTVGANNPQDVKTCLRKCLAHWLRWNYDVDKYGKPSLEKLKAAVEEMGLRDVADKIAQVKKVKDFCQLITRFEALVDKIHGHLADQVKHQKLQAGKVVRVEFIEEKWKLSEGIPDEVSIDTLFNYIQDHYSFLNCSLIEAIVNKHVDKSSRLQEDMKVYVEEMNHFKHSQCLQDLQYAIENVENYNPSEGSDTSCKVVIKLIGKWDKMIINDLESFLRHYFEDEDVFNYLQITPGSVCISYLVPCSAIAHITTAVKSKSESMHRVGVFYFSINGDILLDEKDVNFNESLIEAVKLCEVYEVSLLLSLGADPCYEDSNGDKALELAKHTGNKEIMQAMATAMDSQVIKRKSQEDLSDEKVNKETTDENEKLKVVIQRLQDSNAELEKSLTASKREIEELQSQKKESEQNSEIDKLKESLAESKSTLAKSKDELLALQKENDKLKESLVETKSTLAKSKDESLALQKENDS
ncbi:PREDICTED: uncharacterized protein LOC109589295 [Amphimedon queenslandica]|uniref:Death domain-containing protein n=1 Tax=Amphimedon queenslandica TaxID=400682 RepID=A0AAN0JVM3_AMPQE|nr:PREDICTED: uncharacterized protein LOC109589295 [Amphimedon queenslandica]|eukprot:XP_019860958.1 PREDICTED: uncharacterized protein LOC109589295 [Amphimedon queenslandica]